MTEVYVVVYVYYDDFEILAVLDSEQDAINYCYGKKNVCFERFKLNEI